MISSKERVLAAVDHQVTDRVPLTFDAEPEVYEALHQHLGTSSKEDLFDRLHTDTWILLPRNFIYSEDQVDCAEKTAIWGYKLRSTAYSGGTYDSVSFHPLAGKDDLRDIDNHPWPESGALDFAHFATEAAAHRDPAIIGAFTWGAFHIACIVRGMEDLLIDFAIRKPYAHHLLDTIAQRMFGYLDQMLEDHGEGLDIVYMCDDYCSQRGPLFSPEMFEEFVMPYLAEVAGRVHRHGKKFLLHVCGSVRPFLPMVVEAGVDILEPIQTRAAGMEPVALKRDFGWQLCFYGGVDLQETLCRGTPQQVAAEVVDLIDVLGRDGGYILGPGHTYIQVDAPLENIATMYETAFRHRPWTGERG